MKDITTILENVIIDDEYDNVKPLSRNIMKSFSLSKAISHNKASLSDITYWQWKISEYVYALYVRGIGCSGVIDIKKVMVDKDKVLIDSTIENNLWSIGEDAEAKLINTILNVHMSMFKLINTKHYSKEEYIRFNALRIFGNYFYSAVVSDVNRKVGLHQVINYSEQLHRVTCLGLFNELDEAMKMK